MVGKLTGYRDKRGNPTRVDVWGDVVMATTLPFDSWRHRHNDIQRALVTRALEARVEVEEALRPLERGWLVSLTCDWDYRYPSPHVRPTTSLAVGDLQQCRRRLPQPPVLPGAPRDHLQGF